MKVLFVTHTCSMGGANQSMLRLIVELRDIYNVEVRVIIPYSNGAEQMKSKLLDLNIPFVQLRYYWFKYDSQHLLYGLLKYLVSMLLLPFNLFYLRKYDFDLVHSNGSVIDFGNRIAIHYKKSHVWHLREFGDLDFDLKPVLGKRFESKIYTKRESTFIAISKAISNHFANLIFPFTSTVIYNGIYMVPMNSKAKLNNDILQFCCMGTLTEGKNQYELIRAVDYLVNELGETRFHVSLYGEENYDYKNKLFDYVTQHSICDYITFAGISHNIHEVLKSMDVGIMCSKNEAFGRVTVEYMMQNLAVIASNTGANPEIVINSKTGLLYDSGDYKDLGGKMIYYINEREKVDEMAALGQERALSLFTSSYNTTKVYDVYKQLILHLHK